MLQVNEIYRSIQGEGPRTGRPCVFVRLQGCSLRCKWCDSGYALKKGKGELGDLPIDGIFSQVNFIGNLKIDVCLTGGEPMEQGESVKLVKKLTSRGHHVTVETGGHVSLADLCNSFNDKYRGKELSLCVDSKLPSSGMEARMVTGALCYLTSFDTIKFVVKDDEDLEVAIDRLDAIRKKGTRAEALFSPTWGSDIKNLAESVIALSPSLWPVRFSLQVHKVVWPESKRGV